MKERTRLRLLLPLFVVLLMASCYGHQAPLRHLPGSARFSERTLDSLSFFQMHHYTNNYNFVVRADSLVLLRQLPEEVAGMQTDSFSVYRDANVVVSDIRIVPADSVDSVWVQLANDTSAFGWTHECDMLPRVMPADPISQFISAFSGSHTIIFLIVVAVIVATYLLWTAFRRKAWIVHFHDIQSFYPTLLCLIVSASATFYATIQMFAPQLWQHFYFHPTLNPFSVPPVLGLFLMSVWAMLIVAIAAVDDVRHKLPAVEGLLYLGGLAAVCAVDYIVFSVTTLYYIGYPLLVVYFIFALRQHLRHRSPYVCGNCGHRLKRKGRCPYCGAWNE